MGFKTFNRVLRGSRPDRTTQSTIWNGSGFSIFSVLIHTYSIFTVCICTLEEEPQVQIQGLKQVLFASKFDPVTIGRLVPIKPNTVPFWGTVGVIGSNKTTPRNLVRYIHHTHHSSPHFRLETIFLSWKSGRRKKSINLIINFSAIRGTLVNL